MLIARRITALVLGVMLGIAGAPAAFAAPQPTPITVTGEAPAGTTQVWVDLEGAEAADVQATTVSGIGYRTAQAPGLVTVTATVAADTLRAKPALALTFADSAGTVLAESRHELTTGSSGGSGGTGAANGPAAGGSADGSGSAAKRTGALSRTGADSFTAIAILAALLVLGGGAAFAIRTTQNRRRVVAAANAAATSTATAAAHTEEPRA